MRLEIAYNKKLNEVQSAFSSVFPYLRIEFLRHARRHPKEQNVTGNRFFDGSEFFGDINKNVKDYSVDLEDSTTVSELEQFFTDNIGLPALIFRKSGNIWMETTITANWTLTQQNQHGREISTPLLAQ